MTELCELVAQWAENRGLLQPENANRQFLKVAEELGELAAGMARQHEAEIIDALGDVFVTLIILSHQLGWRPEFTLEVAYNEIKNRTGKTVNGVFIKDIERR